MQDYYKKAIRKREEEEAYVKSGKSKSTAILLGLFLPVGVVRIYLGYYKIGIVQMIFVLLFLALLQSTSNSVNFIFAIGGVAAFGLAIRDLIDIIRGKLLPASSLISNTSHQINTSQKSHSESSVEILEKLAKLKQQGVLTDEEFQTKKAEILKNIK